MEQTAEEVIEELSEGEPVTIDTGEIYTDVLILFQKSKKIKSLKTTYEGNLVTLTPTLY